jgi:hypothetical protein
MKSKHLLTLSAALLLASPLLAQVPIASTFTAGHGSWFDDINWSGGLYPGSNTAATVDGAVVRLHARGLATPLVIQSLTLLNEAEADVRDARLQLDDLTVSNATLRIYASHLLITRLRFTQPPVKCGVGCGGIKFNPSLIEAQEFTLDGTNSTVTFGLGGTNAATTNGLGAGHFARVVCDTARLDGSLAIEFLYGFAPQAGQQFEIIKFNGSGPISGQFVNAPQGALVARYNSVGLYLTYLGGDGNDVVLTAQTLPVATPPLVHATNSGNWFDPLLWSDGQVPTAAKEHVLLARQVGVPAATGSPTAAVKSLSLREGAWLQISNTTFQAESLTTADSSVNVARSHMQLDDFHIVRVSACWSCGIKLNPSLLTAGLFRVDEPGATVTFGLGGTNPATAAGLGAGHYARVVTDQAQLDGNLAVEFLYGFAPQAGQQFEIIHVNTTNSPTGGGGLSGQFVNAPEGALVTRYNNLGLYLTYVGGDGNDVVLSVQPLLAGATPLVHATDSGNWFDPLIWSDGQVPTATKEHVLLARQVGVPAAASGPTAAVKSLSLREGAGLQISNTTFQAESLDSAGSSVNVARSLMQLDDFHVLRVIGCIGFGCGGIKLNPSLLAAGRFTVDEPGATVTFGLGGTNAATATGLGAGHYARVVCDQAQLDGNLAVEFLYGFTPQVGQQFEIIHVNPTNGPNSGLTGRFANVREGGAVAVVGDLMLMLTYVGGDGNDVVLTAVPRSTLTMTKELTGTLVLSYPTARGHFYTVETTTHLAPAAWSPLPIVLGDGAVHTTTTTNSGSAKFHRLFGDSGGN